MEITAEVVGFATSYVKTALDYLIFLRPKAFADARRREADQYLGPVPFLLASLALTTVVGFTLALLLLKGDERESVGRIGILGAAVFVAGVWLVNVFPVLIGKAVAFMLGVPTTLRQMFEAYCYTSALFPFFVGANALAFFTYEDEPETPLLLLATVIQIVFLTLLVIGMGRFSRLTPRFFWRFSTITMLSVLSIGGGAGWAMAAAEHTAKAKESLVEREVLWNVGSSDESTIRIANHSRTPNCSGCWTEHVMARRGEIISLAIYYHHSGTNIAAQDARIRLFIPDGIRREAPIAAEIWSSNSPRRAQGTAMLVNDGNNPVELRFERAFWYPNKNDRGWSPLPRNQTGSEILNPQGISLGDLYNDPCACGGYLVVQLRCE